jgi:hypothetical protein
MSARVLFRTFAAAVFILFRLVSADASDKNPIDVISDNSFLVEEAYNQDPGVIQNIFNAVYTHDPRRHGWTFSFTQEWPVPAEEHQLSYTIPSSHIWDSGELQSGIGDILLNYRYQALEEGERQPAFAPRFSVIIPTGDRKRGTGNGVVGYQWSLPFSKKVASRLALHANWGLTYLPHVQSPLSSGQLSPKRSLVSYNVGGSAIFAILPRLHAMLEWVGNFEDSINDAGRAVHAFKPVISPGFRIAVVNEEELQIVVGAAVPIGLNRHSDNFGAFLYFSVEHKLF